MNKPLTILVHGLHLNSLYMYLLSKRLRQAGFPTYAHNYRSVSQCIEMHSESLRHWIDDHHHDQPFHLVGHSLGGLVIRHFLATYPQYHRQVRHCVTLGTPHLGSTSARYAQKLLPAIINQAYPNALDGRCVQFPDDICLGIIAGSRPIGLGYPVLLWHSKMQNLRNNDSIHDGTVYLSETKLNCAKDHIVLPVSHTGLLYDHDTANQVIYFLEHGRFDHTKL